MDRKKKQNRGCHGCINYLGKIKATCTFTLNLKENQSKIYKLKNVLHYITVQMFVTLKKTATSQGKYPD